GYAVIVIDMFYHGERRLILDEDLERGTNDRSKHEPEEIIRKINQRTGSSEETVFRNILHSGFTWGGVLVWDDIRTVDYLQTRPEVDPNRIACAGLSVGGWRSVFLAGLDPRIKAACVVGWMISFRYLIPHYEVYTVPSGMVPGLLEYLDYPDIGSLAMSSCPAVRGPRGARSASPAGRCPWSARMLGLSGHRLAGDAVRAPRGPRTAGQLVSSRRG